MLVANECKLYMRLRHNIAFAYVLDIGCCLGSQLSPESNGACAEST